MGCFSRACLGVACWHLLIASELIVATMAQQMDSQRSEARAFGASSNVFAFNLYRDLLEKAPTENVFFSPYSVSSAMAMVLLGSDGLTKTQLQNALSLQDVQNVHEAALALTQSLSKHSDGVVLNTANRLFPEKSYQLRSSFLDDAKRYYESGAQELDFKGDADAARRAINDWVYKTTREKIEDLLPAGSVTANTRLVLANAVYFKGNWEARFEKSNTVQKDFHVSSERVVSTDIMTRKAKYNFSSDDSARFQVLEIPYEKGSTSMIIVLPMDKFGLKDVESKLDASKLAQMQKSFRQEELVLGLPKFKVTFGSDLVGSFKNLGATSLFSSNANFGEMTESKDLMISAIAHKAFIEVNEEGTEAAAATGVVMMRMALLPPMEFICDHPFLYFIKHKHSDTILFAGRYFTPQA